MNEIIDRPKPDFSKLVDPGTGVGIIPAIIQETITRRVLMVGFMNQEALDKTLDLGKVTFWSRGKGRLWTKGETSENYLEVVTWRMDCDNDTLLVEARPKGPTCHREGMWTCFD